MKRPEQQVHRAVATFLGLASRPGKFWWCHVPNGGKRTKAEAGIFKALGVKAGVADILIIDWRGKAYWIELKAPGKKKLSKSQQDFSATMSGLQSPYAICDSIDEVQGTLRGWALI